MVRDRCNHFSFWANVCPFIPLTTQNIKIFKKWKKPLEILSFYTSATKIMIICYSVPEIWHVTNVIVIFHFGLFFALIQPKKSKFWKKWKKTPWRHHHFTYIYQKLWSDDVWFLRYGVRQTVGQTDGQMDGKVTYRGGCPT